MATTRRKNRLLSACILLGAAPLGSCDSSTTDPVEADLEALRTATTSFQNFDAAANAGYDTAITPCWYHRDLGGMGFHFGNTALIDGTVQLLEPEALMYEPREDESLELVGMEYIVPIDAWAGAAPPSLVGHDFSRNDALGIYALHIWLWRDNPSGMFADWNPTVSCEHADEAEDRGGAVAARHAH